MGTLESILNNRQNQEQAPQQEFDVEQWKAQKQQELDDLYKTLDTVTSEISSDPNRLKAYLDMQSVMPGYSVGNTLLIFAQNGNATRVASYKDWQEQGRAVKRGETGIKVLTPVPYTREDGADGVAFRVGRLFDVSQTHGDKEIQSPAHESDLQKLIGAIVNDSPARIELDDAVPENIKGRFDISDKAIHIRGDMDDATTFRILARETSHVVLSMRNEEEYNRDGMGMQAYCASYMVCKRYGIEFSAFRADIAQEQIKDMKSQDVRNLLNDIRVASNMICSRIERNLAPQQEQQQQRSSGYIR